MTALAQTLNPSAFTFDLAAFSAFLAAGGDEVFAGIGSRETPDLVCAFMTAVGTAMAARGWRMRSGGAPGADQAFEAGYAAHPGLKEIFLPWKGFEGSTSTLVAPWVSDAQLAATIARLKPGWTPGVLTGRETAAEVIAHAHILAEHFHPAWEKVSPGGRKLHSRNGHQILGAKLDRKAGLVVAWTIDGQATGGTGQAIRLAQHFGIPVLNLKLRAHLEAVIDALGLTGWDVQALLDAPPVKRPQGRR